MFHLSKPADYKKLVASFKMYKQPVPKALVMPEVHDVDYFYWEAYMDLCTERQEGNIPWRAMKEYHSFAQLGTFGTFKRIISGLEQVYHDVMRERLEEATNRGNGT